MQVVLESAWARLRRWHLHAPAERLPLPLVLTAWPSAWVLHARHVPGHVVTYIAGVAVAVTWVIWRRHQRNSPHPRLAAAEAAMVAAAIGGWMAAAVTSGPLGWPAYLLSWIYLAGAVSGYQWLRKHDAVRAARARRDEQAAWTARKAEWHRTAYLIGLGDFHLQAVTPTRLGEELLLTSAPGIELATRVAANSRPYAEKYAHLRGLPYGRVGIRTTEYPRPAGHRDPGEGPVGQRHDLPRQPAPAPRPGSPVAPGVCGRSLQPSGQLGRVHRRAESRAQRRAPRDAHPAQGPPVGEASPAETAATRPSEAFAS